MNDSDETRNPVERLAEEFVERCRRGEHPSVSEYAEAHPAWADQIRQVFPTLYALEDLKSDRDACAGLSGGVSAQLDKPPERLGDFRIIRPIGRGGMGVVYEAEQESLGRRVALKVLPASYSSSPRALERFRREAQAAARLHHTNIVSVFGVGEHEGRRFYVMQYIEGRSLDAVLAELRASRSGGPREAECAPAGGADLTGTTQDFFDARVAQAMLRGEFEPISPRSRNLGAVGRSRPEAKPDVASGSSAAPDDDAREPRSEAPAARPDSRDAGAAEPLGPAYWRSVAGIGAQAARALHYAHRQGTLHRDIKPGNLLLDEQGYVWITDFGLAKLTDQEDLTHPGDVVGTLRYMAPEQLEGTVDARSDVYSLGLTLYELLTLRPAFNETSRHRLLRQVSREQPPRPRTVNPSIPRDLETIVLKAVAREPAHRYQTAGELADDLQRFVEDRAIRARRASAVEHAWRWCRRNPALALLTATTLILLVSGAVGASAGYVRESALRARADSERQRAEANLALAAEAFEDVFFKVSGAPLPRTFEKAGAGDDVWISDVGPPAVGKRDALVLEGLLKFYDRFAEQNRDSIKWQHECGQAYRRVGDIQQRLGRLGEAEEAYGRALERYGRLSRRATDRARYLVELAAIRNQLGNTLLEADRLGEAVEQYRLAQEILAEKTVTAAASPLARFQLAEAYRGMGFAAWLQRVMAPASDAPDAEACLRDALVILSELVEEAPSQEEYRLALAECYGGLWGVCRFAERGQEAMEAKRQAITLLENLIAEFPDNPRFRQVLAWIYAVTSGFPPTGEPEDAVAALQRAKALLEEVPVPYTEVPGHRRILAHVLQGLAEAYFESGQDDRVEEPLQTSTELFAALKEEFPDTKRHRGGLGRCYYLQAVVQNERGQPEAARQTLEQVLDTVGPIEAPPHERSPMIGLLARTYTGLADVYAHLGETALVDQAAARAEEFWATADDGPFKRPHGNPRDPWGSDPRTQQPRDDAD